MRQSLGRDFQAEERASSKPSNENELKILTNKQTKQKEGQCSLVWDLKEKW